ncbi:MAG: YcxB family protein [Prosthecobacter sp.]
MHTFEIQVTPAMARRAWNAWFFPSLRGLWVPLLAVCLILSGTILNWRDGRLETSSIITWCVLGFALVVYVGVYFVGLRRAMAKIAGIEDGRCTYTLTEDRIEAASSLGSMALAWRALSEVRRQRDLVFLGFRGAVYSTIPASDIPPAALDYLVAHARQHGAKIVGFK